MKKTITDRPQHFLICTNQKAKGSCCAEKGSRQLQEEIRDLSKKEGWRRHIRVIGTSCLGHCERGITCRLEPEGVLFTEVTLEDGPQLVEFLKSRLPEAPSTTEI